MRHSVQAYRRIQLEQWLIEADELGMFLNLGVCLLHEEGEVGLKPENLCWVVGLKQLECLLKVKSLDFRECIVCQLLHLMKLRDESRLLLLLGLLRDWRP